MQFAPFSFFNAGGALPPFPVTSGSVFLLTYNEYTNGSTWPTINGPLKVVNSPLVGQGPDGFWQLNGTNDYISASNAQITPHFPQVSSSLYENAPFTIYYYGTIGDLTTRRALAGNPVYNKPLGTNPPTRGTDIIVRTDTSPGTGKASIDIRTGEAIVGQFYRFTVDYTSGSIFDIAIVWDNNQSASCYQNGVQTAISGNVSWQGPSFFQTGSNPDDTNDFRFFSNQDVDASPWNGQVGALAVWNRALDSTEISQSSAYFTANL